MTDLVESEETRQNNTYTELLDQQILEKPHTNFNSINHETNKKLDEINSITRESNNDFPEEDQEQVNQDQLGVTGSLISTSSNPSAYDEQQNCHIVELENQSIDLRTPSYWDNFKSKCCFCQSNNDIPEQVQEQVNYGQLGARPKAVPGVDPFVEGPTSGSSTAVREVESFVEDERVCICGHPYPKSMVKAWNDINLGKEIGDGTFGKVYKGFLNLSQYAK